MGVLTMDKHAQKAIGEVIDARVVQGKDEISLISCKGIVIRMAVADISEQGRATRGVTIMNLEEGDTVAAVARIPEYEAEDENSDEPKAE